MVKSIKLVMYSTSKKINPKIFVFTMFMRDKTEMVRLMGVLTYFV